MRKLTWVVTLVVMSCGSPPPAQDPVGDKPPPPAQAVSLTPSDVTMIWPMPADDAQRDTMIAATTAGAHGELLPAALYQLPILDERDWGIKDPLMDRPRLRVVAARLDPCFASFAPPTDPACINQIRLVMQVLRPGGGQGGGTPTAEMGANDGAVHLFYKVSRGELLALARAVAALRDKHGGAEVTETLGVHPLLARHGLGSAYARELQALLLAELGVARLTRVTFFARTRAREPQWPFGIFDVVGGKLVQQDIVTLGVKRQTLEGVFRKVVDPVTRSADNPDALLSISGPVRAPTAAETAAYAALLRIQNPTKHTPETMACAECHAAQRMQTAAQNTLGLLPTDFAADHFVSPVAPTPESKMGSENFHAAGYLAANLAVSTRTANETAAVVTAMTALLR